MVGPAGLGLLSRYNGLVAFVTPIGGIEDYRENPRKVTEEAASGRRCHALYVSCYDNTENTFANIMQKNAERAGTLLNGTFEIVCISSLYQTLDSVASGVLV